MLDGPARLASPAGLVAVPRAFALLGLVPAGLGLLAAALCTVLGMRALLGAAPSGSRGDYAAAARAALGPAWGAVSDAALAGNTFGAQGAAGDWAEHLARGIQSRRACGVPTGACPVFPALQASWWLAWWLRATSCVGTARRQVSTASSYIKSGRGRFAICCRHRLPVAPCCRPAGGLGRGSRDCAGCSERRGAGAAAVLQVRGHHMAGTLQRSTLLGPALPAAAKHLHLSVPAGVLRPGRAPACLQSSPALHGLPRWWP